MFAAVIWLGGPLVLIGDAQPLESAEARLASILAVWLIALGAMAWRFWSRRRSTAALRTAMTQTVSDESDAPVLKQKMEAALATLASSGKSLSRALYDLPWYVVIGPPGAGKTTALVNSGLSFPLAEGASAQAVAGVGGTRYCDWWFTDRAVLIDTAGRYTTQDSDARADRESWLTFLGLLRESRPLQPINGVIVAISIADVLALSNEELEAHSKAIRQRLSELGEELKVSFPVYVIFTKMDLLSGFTQYFANLDKLKRRAVWGATFQLGEKEASHVEAVPREIDLLIRRVSERMAERLQDEPDLRLRSRLFALPAQLSAIRRPVTDFLVRIFGPAPIPSAATLRGFYFTSGTQEGTPFDAAIGAVKRSYGVESIGGASLSGVGKSYFLHDLLATVVFGEAGWVSTNIAAVRRMFILRIAAIGMVGFGTLGMLGLWWVSFSANAALIDLTRRNVASYAAAAAPAIASNPIGSSSLAPVFAPLDRLLNLPSGYANREQSTPLAATFGLSVRSRVQEASIEVYQAALERLLRPRLVLALEQQIRRMIDDPESLYPKLKAYLMLGGKAPTLDRAEIIDGFQEEWEREFAGGPYAGARAELLAHLQAMLELDAGNPVAFQLDGPLIERAQASLARLRVARHAYTLLRTKALHMPTEDWIASKRSGADFARVFRTVNNSDLDSVRVQAFYTYEGFRRGLIEPMKSIRDRLEKDKWVLGKIAEQPVIDQQYDDLDRDLLNIYTKDFINAWNAALFNLELRPLLAEKPDYLGLQAAVGPQSPLLALLESVREETALTAVRPLSGANARSFDAGTGARDTRPESEGGELTHKAQQKAGEAPPGVPGAEVEAAFDSYRSLLEGAPPRRPIDSLLVNLDRLYKALRQLDDPVQGRQARDRADRALQWLHSNVSRVSPPLSSWIDNLVKDGIGTTSASSFAQLADMMAQDVTPQCLQITNGKYPFAAEGPDVSISDFAKLFMPSGIFDRFVAGNLASYIDMTGTPWTWRPPRSSGQRPSETTLHQLQQAIEIRDAFFPPGESLPNLDLSVKLLTLNAHATSATLVVGGNAPFAAQKPGSTSPTLKWPGSEGAGASITLAPDQPDQTSTRERHGAWALFRLIDTGVSARRGGALDVSFVVGGRDVAYQFRPTSPNYPLSLASLHQFKCPNGL